jgi:HSP20 family molecular chaperone IbpA
VKITGRMNDAYEHTDASYYVKQLSRTSFEKVVRLPDNVKGEPDAVLNDGILKLAWDLPTELDESKVIRVKSLDGPALENKKAK